jgi:hypothetical protein
MEAARLLGRRDLLRVAAGVAGAGLLPTGCGSLPPELVPAAGEELHVLTPRTYAVLTAAAMRIVGPVGAGMIARRELDAGRVADRWLRGAPVAAGPLGTALLVLEFGVPPLVWKLRAFTRLAGVSQDAVLTELMTAGWDLKRQLFGGVRALAMLAFYGSPASRVVTGYPGPFGGDGVTIDDAMVDPDASW